MQREIRPFRPEDAANVAQMWNESDDAWPGGFTHGVPFTAERVLHWQERERDIAVYIAFADGKAVGYCSLTEFWEDSRVAYVRLLGAHPEYHGQGFGRDLLRAALERTVSLGYERLDLHTWAGNLKAVPLYKKTGFYWLPGTAVHMHNYLPTVFRLDAARRFAHAGYEVLLPDLGKTDLLGPGDLLSLRADVRLRGGVRVESSRIRKVVELYDDALEYLRTRPMVDPGRTAVFGASYGGSLALAVAGEGRNLVGVALAFPQPIAPGDYARLLNAPVLVVAGDRDASAQRCRDQLEAARAHGLDLRVEMIPGQGHLFLARESRAYDLSSAEAAWTKILRFLQERLVPPPPKPPVPPVARTVPTPGAAPAAPAPRAPSAVRAVPPVPEPPSPPPLRPA